MDKNSKRTNISLRAVIDPGNTLARLTDTLDWAQIIERYQRNFPMPFGGRVSPPRLLVGLAMLRQLYELSDVALFNLWSENPYFQYFCGGELFQDRPPFDQFLVRMLPRLSSAEVNALLGSATRPAAPDAHNWARGEASSVSPAENTNVATKKNSAESGSDKPPRLTDVAKCAGVSVKTVSLVLNHHPNVSERTRRLVQDAVLKLSYKPNVFARGLATLQSNLIAILYAGEGEFIAALEAGALIRAREAGYHILVEPLDPDSSTIAQHARELLAKNALHGVVIVPPLCDNPELIAELQAARARFVTVSAGLQTPGVPNVGVDDAQIGYDATHHLLQIGHRRIGFISGLPNHYAAARRIEGYQAALKDYGIMFDPALCLAGDFTLDSGRAAAKDLLQMDDRPTAIFAASDQMAAGVLGEAQSIGLNVPNELSVAGVDDSVIAKIVWPQLTTCQQPIKKMGYAAVSILLFDAQDQKPENLRLEHQLVMRGSTAPPRV